MGVLTDLVRKHNLEHHVNYNSNEIVEGPNSILSPLNSSTLDSIKIAHFFSSQIKGGIVNLEPAKGSVYEQLNDRFG